MSQLHTRKSVLVLILFLSLGLAAHTWAAASHGDPPASAARLGNDAAVSDEHCDQTLTTDITLVGYTSDLAYLRQFRDQMLDRAKKGKFRTRIVYIISEKGLKVLHKNPHMIPRARHLIEANQSAISEAINGSPSFVVYDGDEVVAFLHDYSQKAPLFLKILTCMLRRSIVKRQKKGELIFVSDHNAHQTQQETNTL